MAGIDSAPDCKKTYSANIKNAEYLECDVSLLDVSELEHCGKIQKNDPDLIFIGCSPCQFWSKIRTDKTKSSDSANLLEHFQRFVAYYRPGFVVIENVPGLYKRKAESVLSVFTQFLSEAGYVWKDGVINANYYGVPQKRKRYLLLASHALSSISLPAPKEPYNLNIEDFIGERNGFKAIPAGHIDQTGWQHTAAGLSRNNIKRIAITPKSGGCRSAWASDEELQIPTYRGRDAIFRDVYGRMAWGKPSPTITTRFNSLSNGRFGHPEEDRAISIREGATLQTFPKNFLLYGGSSVSLAKQIGNAVPPELARRIGIHIKELRSHG